MTLQKSNSDMPSAHRPWGKQKIPPMGDICRKDLARITFAAGLRQINYPTGQPIFS